MDLNYAVETAFCRKKIVLLVSIALLAVPAQALTSRESPSTEVLSSGIQGLCMAKTVTGDAGSSTIKAIVPVNNARVMLSAGFRPAPCRRLFRGSQEQLKYRDWVCDFTASRSEWMQAEFKKHVGVRPAALCGMAELSLSDWDTGNVRRAR